MLKALTGAEKQARYRKSQRALGRQRVEFWLTPRERRELERLLAALRAE